MRNVTMSLFFMYAEGLFRGHSLRIACTFFGSFFRQSDSVRRIPVLLFLLFLLCAASPDVFAQTGAKSAATVALETEMKMMRKDACMKNAAWSVCVMDISTGKIISQYNQELSLVPASVMKLFTTATALAMTDTAYRFETRLQHTGYIDITNSVLKGDLIIAGGGDPTIGSARFGSGVSLDSIFNKFHRALIASGIRKIEGRLIADESIFSGLPPGSWNWDDIGNYYATNAGGLSVNENKFRLTFEAGSRAGDPAKLIRTEPELQGMTLVSNVKTAGANTGDNVIIYGSPYSGLRVVEGTIPLGKKNFNVEGAMPDPAMYFVHTLALMFAKKGIIITDGATTLREEQWHHADASPVSDNRKELYVYRSPALSEIVYHTNLRSVNLFAEALLKLAGHHKTREGTVTAGADAVKYYWKAQKVNLDGFEMYDGSGLSRKNKLTTLTACQMLTVFYKNPVSGVLIRSLPVAGKSGGMRYILGGTTAEGNLMAKTGNMSEVRSYAGYVTTKSGQPLAFAIIMNNFTCPTAEVRQKCETLMKLISELD